MDKLQIYEGDMPIWLDDFNWIDKGIRDTFTRLAMSFTGTRNAILSGFEVSTQGSQTTWTEGVLLIDGEILPVDSGSLSLSPESLYINISQTYNTAGDRTFRDGQQHSCYAVRKAVLSVISSSPSVKLSEIRRLEGVMIKEKAFLLKPSAGVSIAGFVNKCRILASKSGGFYIQGTFSLQQGLDATVKSLFTDATVEGLDVQDAASLLDNVTLVTVNYLSDGLISKVIPATVSFSQSNNTVRCSISLTENIQLSGGEGYYYTRLLDV